MQNTFLGAAAALAARTFRGYLEEDKETGSVGTTPVKVFKQDSERTFLHIINLSGVAMYLGFAQDVSSSNGILLSANGGFVIINAKDDYTLATNEFWLVADAAASNYLYHSMRRFEALTAEEVEDVSW